MATASTSKGKGRETDFEDLDPVITYRHLLSSGLGVRNPLRVCGLTDMDAFYAACEQNRLGIDSETPLVVRQWDALIAVNYPARKYGISRMDKVKSALERCPHLLVVHVATFDPSEPDAKPKYTDNPNSETDKVSLDYYRKESRKIMDVFKEMLPGAEVERASIDEAFIDFTELVRQQILAQFPHFASPPPEGLDMPLPPPPREGVPLSYPLSRSAPSKQPLGIWSDLGTLVPFSGQPLSKGADVSTEGVVSMGATSRLFQNISRVGESENQEGSSRNLFRTSTERSWSAEVEDAENEEDYQEFLDEEDFQLPDVPPETLSHNEPVDDDLPPTWHDVALSIAASMMLRMRDEVKTRLGYTTSAGIARNKFLAKLVASFKKRDNQTILRNAAIPRYLRPLPFQKIRFLGGKLGMALATEYEAQTVGDLLSISIEEMQRKFGESSIWVWEILRGIDRSEVKEKPSMPKSMGASKNLKRPVTHPSEGAHWLRILAGELSFRLQEAREDNTGLWPKTLVLHIRQSYAITRSKQTPFPFSRAVNIDYICKFAERLWAELVGTAAEYDKNKGKGKATAMKITNIFLGFSGVESISTGQRNIEGFFAGNDRTNKRKTDENGGDVGDERSPKKRSTGAYTTDDLSETDIDHHVGSGTEISFRCSRCGKQVRRTIDDLSDRDSTLDMLKMEHEDFHYAQDLSRETDGNAGHRKDKKTKKSKSETKGIAKFFTPVTSKR